MIKKKLNSIYNSVRILFKKLVRVFVKPKFYKDLNDIPLYNWRKLHETGDYSFLLKKGSLKNVLSGEVTTCWHRLNNEYLTKYGLDLKTKMMLRDRKRLALALANYIATLDKDYEMEADILKIDIKRNNTGGGKSVSYMELIADIEEIRGMPIDELKTSTDRFYTYLKKIKDRQSKSINFKAA